MSMDYIFACFFTHYNSIPFIVVIAHDVFNLLQEISPGHREIVRKVCKALWGRRTWLPSLLESRTVLRRVPNLLETAPVPSCTPCGAASIRITQITEGDQQKILALGCTCTTCILLVEAPTCHAAAEKHHATQQTEQIKDPFQHFDARI